VIICPVNFWEIEISNNKVRLEFFAASDISEMSFNFIEIFFTQGTNPVAGSYAIVSGTGS
jgi:hypothetical protein